MTTHVEQFIKGGEAWLGFFRGTIKKTTTDNQTITLGVLCVNSINVLFEYKDELKMFIGHMVSVERQGALLTVRKHNDTTNRNTPRGGSTPMGMTKVLDLTKNPPKSLR